MTEDDAKKDAAKLSGGAEAGVGGDDQGEGMPLAMDAAEVARERRRARTARTRRTQAGTNNRSSRVASSKAAMRPSRDLV
jgi:hypothetical protein